MPTDKEHQRIDFDFGLWRQMLIDELWWKRDLCVDEVIHIYRTTVTAWGHGSKYHANDPVGGSVELTKIYEQCKLVSALKKDYHGKEISSTDC